MSIEAIFNDGNTFAAANLGRIAGTQINVNFVESTSVIPVDVA